MLIFNKYTVQRHTGKLKSFVPRACWWFFPKTTSALRRPSSAAECWSDPLCSAPRAFCPRGSWEHGSPRRTRLRCPVCERRTGGWCGPRAPRTIRVRRQNHNLDGEKRGRKRLFNHLWENYFIVFSVIYSQENLKSFIQVRNNCLGLVSGKDAKK